MSKVAHFPTPRGAAPETELSDAVVLAFKAFVAKLPPREQERVLQEITDMLRPIPAPRAGDVLSAVVRLLPKQRDWTVAQIKQVITDQGVAASPKEIYNAVAYLTRTGRIRRVGYGRYVVDGIEVVTSDDLGGQSSRHEDAYRTDREDG